MPRCADPVLDRAAAEAQRAQLAPAHHPVLARGKLGDELVDVRLHYLDELPARKVRPRGEEAGRVVQVRHE
jgi:hypothetical protein